MKTAPGSLYATVADLSVTIDSHDLRVLRQEVSSGFERVTTVVRMRGAGHTGVGEDVTYEAEAHDRTLPERSAFPLAGTRTLNAFSRSLEELLPAETEPHARWGFESAAFDLALRQAGTTLGAVFGREPRRLRFVVSTRLGSPPDPGIVLGWLRAEPSLEFKLDPQSSWTWDLAVTLEATGRVRVLDLKGAYKGTPVDQEYDPDLYLMIAREFPSALIEDPAPTEEALSLLASAGRRLSWDAVIHSVEDVKGLARRPGAINIKPSRFGSLRRLLDTVEYCLDDGIPLYGGGQFELGPGRGQIQELAAVFYPDGPNDVAPREYNHGDPRAGLPANPLTPPADERIGFGWDEWPEV